MTNFFKNVTEEGKNVPARVNAQKKRPLVYVVLVSRDGKPRHYWGVGFKGILILSEKLEKSMLRYVWYYYRGLNVP